MKKQLRFLIPVLCLLITIIGFFLTKETPPQHSVSLESIPEFVSSPYVIVCENVPDFSEKDLDTDAYEFYSELDRLGRCGYAMACIGPETMPTEERGSIGQVKPSGWHTVKYDFVDGKYLYNRCHLIGYQLTGENANERNLITGTRYLNTEGMLPFEDSVADYIKETGNHVLYRVTPIFDGEELVARGVQMEAMSLEDDGAGIRYNVYVYNNQPGVIIDYATGKSSMLEQNSEKEKAVQYILNTSTKRIHEMDCALSESIKQTNRENYTGNIDVLIAQGYKPCGNCNP